MSGAREGENGIKRGVRGGRVGEEGGWAERGKKQGWYRGKKVGSCGNCRGGSGRGRGCRREGTLLAANDGGGEGGGVGSSTTGQFEYSGEHGDERGWWRTHGPGA